MLPTIHYDKICVWVPIKSSSNADLCCSDTLAFATEPVLGTLANVLGCLEDRLPQNLPALVKEYTFLDIEIKYGLLQVRFFLMTTFGVHLVIIY